MVKKTAKTSKPNTQRTREEQWRRRVAAQGGSVTGGAMIDRAEMGAPSDGAEDAYGNGAATAAVRSPSASSTTRTGAATRSRTTSVSSSSLGAAQRRIGQPTRAGRMKMATQAMSIDEEMHYVKSDIRRLIILTAVCLVVLIALSFVIR